jgi:hypothetical protein
VRVRSTRASMVLTVQADSGVPRGVVAVDFNLGSADLDTTNAAAALIDAGAVLTDVRLESV